MGLCGGVWRGDRGGVPAKAGADEVCDDLLCGSLLLGFLVDPGVGGDGAVDDDEVPWARLSMMFSPSLRKALTRCQVVAPSCQVPSTWRRSLTATVNSTMFLPPGVTVSSGSAASRPSKVTVVRMGSSCEGFWRWCAEGVRGGSEVWAAVIGWATTARQLRPRGSMP